MSLTWLHISDLHVRGGDPYDRDTVLAALAGSVRRYAESGRAPDLIFVTGDIAYSGKATEYQAAEPFFDELLRAARLDRSRLFVVPGNHDADRDSGLGLARTLDSREQADAYFHPDRRPPHLTMKLAAFRDWHNRYFAGIRTLPDNSTCGPVARVEINGHRLGILPMNTALFCQDDDDRDHGKLWTGRRPLEAAIKELKGLEAEVNIGLLHHPLEWLHPEESASIQALVETHLHILLRGHLHETRIDTVASPEGAVLRCAAGAAYQTRKWPNRALYATLDAGSLTLYPIRYEDSPLPTWTTDPSAFPHDPGHERTFSIPRLAPQLSPAQPVRTAPLPRFRSNIGTRGSRPFVGRADSMARLANLLGEPGAGEKVIVLHGEPGVGKSGLAREFARVHRNRYSGGTFWVDASTDAVAIQFANIAATILDMDFPPGLPLDLQGERAFLSLGAAPVLLIYDNVVSFERIAPWLPRSGMPCHVLITTLLDAQGAPWECVEVPRLPHAQSVELVEKLAGAAFAARYGEAIATHAGGLPVQIVPETTTLAYEVRRGRTPSGVLGVADPAGESFRGAFERLDGPPRLLLLAAAFLNPQRIPAAELSRHLRDGAGWSDEDFRRSLDACMDLHLLDGVPDPSMHQLFATFLREMPLPETEREPLARVWAAQGARFFELAGVVGENPADTQAASALLAYPMAPDVWEGVGQRFPAAQDHMIGSALHRIGRFLEARPWCERAVAEAEKGDVHGRVDHESLGTSLHQFGYCLARMGQFAEARPWFGRAVAEAEKGDIHGRIDHALLSLALRSGAACLRALGETALADEWERKASAHDKL